MKKVLLTLSLVITLGLSMSSCCKRCTGPFGIQVDICRNEYDTETDYNNAIVAMEIGGYNCQ